MSHYKPYPVYKESGVEWLGRVPEHWAVMSVKHIVSIPITDGPHETPEFVDEGIPFISAEAISSGRIDFNKIRGFITEKAHHHYSQKYHPMRGDIFMIKSGATTGITAIVDTDVDFNIWSPLAAIRCGERVDPKFVLNFLRSRNFQDAVELYWSVGTQQNIGMGVIGDLSIAVPPIGEQITIAAQLAVEITHIDILVAKKTRFIGLLREKRQALITQTVSKGINSTTKMKNSRVEWLGTVPQHWKIKKLKHIARIVRGASPRPAGDPKYFTSDNDDGINTPWLTVAEITKDKEMYLLNTSGYLTPLGVQQSQIFTVGTLVLTNSGATLGVPKILSINCCANDGVLAFKSLASFVNIKFVYYFLSTTTLRLREEMQKGGQPNLNTDVVKSMDFPMAPLDEQSAIVAFLERETARIDTLIYKTERSIELIKERRTALITAAVTGQINLRRAT